MQRSKRRAIGLLLAGLLATGGARAGDLEDVALTVAVRKALTRDEKLAALGLGVTVADGQVTVWGPVPSAELAALVEARVKSLAGVRSVATRVYVLPVGASEAGRTPAPRIVPKGPEPVVLSPLPGLSLALVRADPEDEKSAIPPTIKSEESRRTVAKGPAPEILAPEGVTRASPTLLRPEPSAPRADLAGQIEAILDRNAKYDGLSVVIQSGLVRLSGTLPSWTDLWPLSEELSKLPGVKRVVVDKITIVK